MSGDPSHSYVFSFRPAESKLSDDVDVVAKLAFMIKMRSLMAQEQSLDRQKH